MELMDKATIRELLLTGDIFHTINGGRVKATTSLTRADEHYILEINAPGISADNLQVQIENDQLLIIHMLEHTNSEQQVQVPFMIDMIDIPFDVNITGIHASFEEGGPSVILPFNELADGFHKNIGFN